MALWFMHCKNVTLEAVVPSEKLSRSYRKRIVVDNVTTLGSVRFYISKRVGGHPLNNDAIKWIRTAA